MHILFCNFVFKKKKISTSWHLLSSVALGYEGGLLALLPGKLEAELRVFHLAFGGIFDALMSSEVASHAGRERDVFPATRS